MNDELKQTLKLLPDLSGCYLYYDKDNTVIYVGKAKNLKRRVKSYFNRSQKSTKTIALVSKIERLEYIITDTEVEAFILEDQLIKKYKPKYNILLKDDKKYPYFLSTGRSAACFFHYSSSIPILQPVGWHQDQGKTILQVP